MPHSFRASEMSAMRQLAHHLSSQCASPSSTYRPLAKSLRALRNTLEEAEDAFESFGEAAVWSAETRVVRATDGTIAVLKSLESLFKDEGSENYSDLDITRFVEVIEATTRDLAEALSAHQQTFESFDAMLNTPFQPEEISPSEYSPCTPTPYSYRPSISTASYSPVLPQRVSQDLRATHSDTNLQKDTHHQHSLSRPWGPPFPYPDPLSTNIDAASSMILRSETRKCQDRLGITTDATISAPSATPYTESSLDDGHANITVTQAATERLQPRPSTEMNSILPNSAIRRSVPHVSPSATDREKGLASKIDGAQRPFKAHDSRATGERIDSMHDGSLQFGLAPSLQDHNSTKASEDQPRSFPSALSSSSKHVEPVLLVDTISAKLQQDLVTSLQTFDLHRDTQNTLNSLRAVRRKDAAKPTYRIMNPDLEREEDAPYVPRQPVLQAPAGSSSPPDQARRIGMDSPPQQQRRPSSMTYEPTLTGVIPPTASEAPMFDSAGSGPEGYGIDAPLRRSLKPIPDEGFQSQLQVKAPPKERPSRYRRRTFNGSEDPFPPFDGGIHPRKQPANLESSVHPTGKEPTQRAHVKSLSALTHTPEIPTIILSEETDTGKEACMVPQIFSDLEVDVENTREHELLRLWNDGHWSDAKILIKHMLDDLHKVSSRTITRRLSHLLGVIASIQGEWRDALDHFLLAFNSPLMDPSAVDSGDCAAAYWLGDTYALLGRMSEALLAYCIAEHGPLFQGSEGYAMHRCIRSEQAACQAGVTRSDFKLQMDRKMLKKEPTSLGSIFDTRIVTMDAARQFLESACWPPEDHNLSQSQNRTAALWGQGFIREAWHESHLLRLDASAFAPTAAWPMPFDPYFAMANVTSRPSSAQTGDLLTIASSDFTVKTIPKGPAFSRKGMEQFTSHDLSLTWLIKAVRGCLKYLECEWSEILPEVDPRRPGFAACYDTVESGIATKHFFSITIIRPTLRPGYGVELCPDGMSSARIVRSEQKFDRGVHQDELKRFKKRMRKYLEAARERQEDINVGSAVMPVVSLIGAKPWGFDHRTSAKADEPARSGSSSIKSGPDSMSSS